MLQHLHFWDALLTFSFLSLISQMDVMKTDSCYFFQAIFTYIMSYNHVICLYLDFSFRRKYCLSLYLHVDKMSLYLDYLGFFYS